MRKGVVTIKEIAKQLKISPSTVSRALSDHPRIGLRTKMRVKDLAEELGYEPNRQAIAFKQKKTFTIGLLLPGVQEEFFSDVITGIEDVALQEGYSVLIGQSHNDVKQGERILKTMMDHRVDGMLITIGKDVEAVECYKKLNRQNLPIVFFDRIPQESRDINAVWCNIYDTTLEAMDYLVGEGHRYIAYVRGPLSLKIKNERYRAYKDRCEKYDLPVDDNYILHTDLSSEMNCQVMKKLLALPNPPTAVVAFNDNVALDVIRYCKEQGLKINKDISFVSYGNWPITEYMESRPLISIEQFPYEQGSGAAELLFEILNHKGDYPPKNVILDSKMLLHQ